MTDLPLIPTTVVGSHGKPGWWYAAVGRIETPPGGLGIVKEFEYLRAHTSRQIDEPARGNLSGAEMARLFNLATEGVRARLAYHICFGHRHGRSRFDRSYRPYFPGLLEARADQFVLEFASRELSEQDLWAEVGRSPRTLANQKLAALVAGARIVRRELGA